MSAESGDFWNRRYRSEGAIWGEGPSPTAVLLATLLPSQARVLDIGFGYGRDLVYLAAHGFRVSGIETSADGHAMALERLARQGLRAEQLYHGRFEDANLPCAEFDAVLNHRMAHLLTSAAAVSEFAACVRKVLRPLGMLALAARSLLDYDPAHMVLAEPHVYEYRARPGHRIRYWDDDAVRLLCSAGFVVLRSGNATESETAARPVPCHLLVLVLQADEMPLSLPASTRGRPCP